MKVCKRVCRRQPRPILQNKRSEPLQKAFRRLGVFQCSGRDHHTCWGTGESHMSDHPTSHRTHKRRQRYTHRGRCSTTGDGTARAGAPPTAGKHPSRKSFVCPRTWHRRRSGSNHRQRTPPHTHTRTFRNCSRHAQDGGPEV